MNREKGTFLADISTTIERAKKQQISEDRKAILQPLVDYIQTKVNDVAEINLNFICTHNSRRSQFLQIWAQTAADHLGLNVNCYSGGVEVTEFNPRAVESIKRNGFAVKAEGEINPVYSIYHSENGNPITAFSKLYHAAGKKGALFAGVMSCAHADETCVNVVGAEARIPVRYNDPKRFDGTPEEAARYDETSLQAASEMFYVFSEISLPQE